MKLPFRKDKELYSSLYHIIGFYPHDIEVYKLALMHKSVMHRTKKGRPANNERLEFLGDAILDAAVGDIVYRHFPGKREGFLTNTRSKLVQRETLGRLAKEMGIVDLVLSAGHSSSHNSYMGGNAFEALVGAIYLDRGYDACMRFIKRRILAQMINIDKVAYKEVNFKSKLIEWSQKNKVRLSFRLEGQGQDKAGSPTFTYRVMLETCEGCTGQGFSKKESQQRASRETLQRLRREPQFIDAVFAAKGERTRMEEEPQAALPDTAAAAPFLASTGEVAEEEKHPTVFTATVYTEQESAQGQARGTSPDGDAVRTADDRDGRMAVGEETRAVAEEADDEFDLSDISARRATREEIIARAEEAAFG